MQAGLLQNRLLERGYSRSLLKKDFNKTSALNRKQLLYRKNDKTPDSDTRCILTFNRDHLKIKTIFQKYWFLLTEDPILGHYFPANPSITFTRPGSIGDWLVSSHFTDTPKKDPCKNLGTFACGSCEYCGFLDLRTKATLHRATNGNANISSIVTPQESFCHVYKFEGFLFLPLEIIHIHPRGGDWDEVILRMETK